MDRQAAVAEAERLNREAPDRDRFRWSVREVAPEDWQVVRFVAPGGAVREFKTAQGTEPHRPDPGELPPPTHRPEWGPV
jgi:hypothetical protein